MEIILKDVKQWEENLHNVYDGGVWEECIQESYSLFLGNKLKEIQYRIMH